MSFEKAAPGIRRVTTNRNDTLKRIALRELGDASMWVDIAVLNGLKPPYIVKTKAEQVAGVIVAGDVISIPAPTSYYSVATDADGVFLKDCLLSNGLLRAVGGDIEKATGLDNLKQALQIRIETLKTELMFHPEYGCYIKQLLGEGATATAQALAAFYVKSSLLEDDRVDAAVETTAEVLGDTIMVNAVVQPITGRQVDVSAFIK